MRAHEELERRVAGRRGGAAPSGFQGCGLDFPSLTSAKVSSPRVEVDTLDAQVLSLPRRADYCGLATGVARVNTCCHFPSCFCQTSVKLALWRKGFLLNVP